MRTELNSLVGEKLLPGDTLLPVHVDVHIKA